MSESPPHWCWVTVGDIGSVTGGLTQNSRREVLAQQLPYLRVANVYANELRLEQVFEIGVQQSEVARALLVTGDLLVVEGNGSLDQIGRVAVWNGAIAPCLHQNHLIKIRFLPSGLGRFALYWFLSSAGRGQITRVASSTSGLHTLSISKVQALEIPLSPLPEQLRIVEAIESYFTRLDDAVATLERVERNLKRYRASVLKSAVEGRLVPTEAALAKQEGRDYEPASVLLDRILTERRRRWSESGRKGKYQEPGIPDTANLPELPEGWCWASSDQLAAGDRYALAIGPFGSNLRVPDYTDSGVPLIFVRNIRSERFGLDGEKCVSVEKAEELSAHWAYPGDILITKMGEPPGDACIYPLGRQIGVITADCIRIRPSDLLNTAYLLHSIRSHPVQSQIRQITKGVAQKKVSLEGFRTVAIPLAPLAEQHRIAAHFGRVDSIILAASAEAKTAATRCQRLRQSILKWAFEGKLADQDPTDEPASVLLARIKAERKALMPAKPNRTQQRADKVAGSSAQPNLIEVMASVGQSLRDEGFDVNAERFERLLKQDREDEDASSPRLDTTDRHAVREYIVKRLRRRR